jgi:hypothetical protein
MKSINFVVGALQQYTAAKKKQTEAAQSNKSVSVQESPDLSAFLGAAQELKALQKRMEQMNRNTTRPLSQVSGVHVHVNGRARRAPRTSRNKRKESVAWILT